MTSRYKNLSNEDRDAVAVARAVSLDLSKGKPKVQKAHYAHVCSLQYRSNLSELFCNRLPLYVPNIRQRFDSIDLDAVKQFAEESDPVCSLDYS